jgi:hypothetical protein
MFGKTEIGKETSRTGRKREKGTIVTGDGDI